MPGQHFIVLIDQPGWRVVHASGQQVLVMRVFERDEDSRRALLDWWQQFPQAKVSFLTNHADEHYHVETLPQVRGSAGRQLLMRKLAAWPYAQGMHTACYLDNIKGLRRESRFLFVALTYSRLADWLSVLQKESIRVQGVYTQALCLACCLPSALRNVMHGLCVQYTVQQIRISYFQKQRLFFSRLILLPPDMLVTAEDCVSRIAQEITQTRMTLIHQHWLQEAEALSLIWLNQAPADAQLVPAPLLKAQLPAACVWVEAAELACDLTRNVLSEGLQAIEWAAIQLILNDRRLPNLAPESGLMLESCMRIKRRLHWAGAVMLALMALAGWAGSQATYHAQAKMQQTTHQLKVWQLKSSEHINQSQLPDLHALTQAIQGVQSSVRLPGRALAIMQHAVTGVSHWQVVALAWDFSAGAPLDTVATQHATVWKETLTVTWSPGDQGAQAAIEWQQLLTRLRGLPEVEKVEVLTPSTSASHAQRQGGTGPAPVPDQPPVLKLTVRDVNQANAL